MNGPIISGGSGANGKASVVGKDGTPLAELLAFDNEAVIGAGNRNRPGRLTMYNGAAQNTVNLTTADAKLTLGTSGVNGQVSVRGKDGTPLAELLAFDNEAVIGAGNKNRPGRLTMYNSAAQNTVNLTTADARLALGNHGVNGQVSVMGRDGQPLVELLGRDDECVIGLGQSGRPGRISVYGADRQEKVRLDGTNGDVILTGADCAEEFDIVEVEKVEAGTVMVIDEQGALQMSDRPYDKRVAGVISGAGEYKPGLVLDRQQSQTDRKPIALVGKVYCKVDADYGAIQVGDLLTTSASPGHAMKAADPLQAFGAVIGKALRPLEAGQSLIPILVALQ